MNVVEQALANLKNSLLNKVELSALHSRNPIAHRWKALFRSFILRETVAWRLHDLLSQSYVLHQQRNGLGARILLRSGFETVATLIYLNQLTASVVAGALNFHDFCDKTVKLLLGSRNKSTEHESINILTVLQKCDKKYPSLMALYADLSESAHPSYEGTCIGYSTVDRKQYIAKFGNRWMDLYGDMHLPSMQLCITIFGHEYDDVWKTCMEQLESWIEANNSELEATKLN